MPKLTICGGGNAAHVLIALAVRSGWEVDVFAPLADEAERLRAGMAARGGMAVQAGGETIVGQARRVSNKPDEVVPGSELIFLALPAFAHGSILEVIADSLDPQVVIVALPARGGFDYQALSVLGAKGLSPVLVGLQTLPWACRITNYGQEAEILGTKAAVDLAAYPGQQASHLVELLTPIFDTQLTPVSSFLTLTLANTGQLIHPGIMYGLCRGQEENTFTATDIPLFYQGVDQATADMLQTLSDELQTIAGALAAHLPQINPQEVITLHQWLLRSYPNDIVDGTTLRSAFVTNRAYAGLKVPARKIGLDTLAVDFSARYLSEDVPFGLVVVRGLAELADVSTPTLDEVITWAQTRLGRQYLLNGTLSGSDLAQSRAPQVYGIRTLSQLIDPP